MVLVDSSVWIEALRTGGDTQARQLLADLLESGLAAWCPAIRLEIWASVRDDRERKVLRHFSEVVVDLRVTDAVWERAIKLAGIGRRRGYSFPYPDLLVFACAKIHGVELLHRDKHFDLLERMWLPSDRL